MRVEVHYAPGCSSYNKAKETLETVIAEEGLPLPVELVEDLQMSGAPIIRINGNVLQNSPVMHQIEHLRDAICNHWKELTEKPLSKLS